VQGEKEIIGERKQKEGREGLNADGNTRRERRDREMPP